MTLDEKLIEAIRKTQTGLEKVVLNKTMDRILDDQSFTEQNATCATRESLKTLRGTHL